MFDFIRNWLERRIINTSPVTPEEWQRALAELPLLKGLSENEPQRFRG